MKILGPFLVLAILAAITIVVVVADADQKSFIDGCNSGMLIQRNLDARIFHPRAPMLPPSMRTCEMIYKDTK